MKIEDKVESQLLLNVMVQEGAAVLKLLAGKDEDFTDWEGCSPCLESLL